MKPPDIPLLKAASGGDIEAVKQHLAAGTDVNAKDIDGKFTAEVALPTVKVSEGHNPPTEW